MLFIKLQRSFECNEWFLTILYLTSIEFLILCPIIFFTGIYISQLTNLIAIPIVFFGSLIILYILNRKVYEKKYKAIVYELAEEYDKIDLNKIRLLVLGIFLAACGFFIFGIHLVSRL